MEKITDYLIRSTVNDREVSALAEAIMLPSNETGKEEKDPIFLEKRVCQVVKPAIADLTDPWISDGIMRA